MNETPSFVPDGVIFDLDGTLWDTTELCARAWSDAAREFAVSRPAFTAEDLASIMGMAHDEVFAKLFPGVTGRLKQDLAKRCYELEAAYLLREGHGLYEGVEAGLARLAERTPLFLVSNCEVSYLEAFWQVSGLKHLFRDWTCHGATRLPKGANIRSMVRRHELSKAIYVGDTESDARAAEQAEVMFVQARYGFGIPLRDSPGGDSFDGVLATVLVWE